MAERVGLVPIVIDFLGAVEDPRRADVEQRDVELVGDMDGILDRQGVGRIGVVRILVAIFEAGMGAEVEETVRPEGSDVGAIGVEIAEIEEGQPILVDVDVGAPELRIGAEHAVERLAEHAARAGHVDSASFGHRSFVPSASASTRR
jgi:hypothetical protein